MYEANILLGVQTLSDYYHGRLWQADVNGDNLNMAFETDCLLGQLFGGFTQGVHILGISDEESLACGFHLALDWEKFYLPESMIEEYRQQRMRAYATLTEQWQAYLSLHAESVLSA